MNRLLRSLSALTLLTLASLTQAAGTAAGTSIMNQAEASALTPDQTPITSLSNLVTTTVAAICAVSVTPDGTTKQPGQQQTVLPGESAVFAYRVVNSGNTPFTLPLTALVLGESGFKPTLGLYLDANKNGQLDDGERTPIQSVNLEADASATVFIAAQSQDSDAGDGFVNLAASCAGQNADDNNVALLHLGPPPSLVVTKTFSPALVKPGSQTTVTIVSSNTGQGASREVVLSDDLTALAAQGLSYVPGSAVAGGGSLEVSGSVLRVRTPSLKPGALLTLTFKMLADLSTENKILKNTATASTGHQSVSGSAFLTSQYSPQVALGPVHQPEAAEDTPADTQHIEFALVGKVTCFDQSLKNTGDVRDSYALSSAVETGQLSGVVFQTPSGGALTLPINLEPGAGLDFKVCFVPGQTGALSLRLTAKGSRNTHNATLDTITAVQAGLPDLLKSVSPSGMVPTGTTLTYTLSAHNPYTVALNGVTLHDPLSAAVGFISASDGGKLENGKEGNAVVWTLSSLAPGETRRFSITVKVDADTADGTNVTNTFTLSSRELPDPLPSNEVSTPIWTSKLVIEKSVDRAEVTYGDRLTYTLTVRNLSAKAPLQDGVVTDTPAKGLIYVPGTAALAGKPLADPEQQDGHLSWQIGTLLPSSNVVITYQARVTAEAGEELLNTVIVSGRAVAGVFSTAIASNTASAKVKLKLLTFAPLNDIVGQVYIDRNRNGRFDPELDQPIEHARILLAGGREVLSDSQGRYHFKDVQQGLQALRLDPGSVPSVAISLPMDGGLRGTRTVNVLGLTAVDFPLAPLTGDIDALRSVALSAGPLSLSKTVTVNGQHYAVTLRLSSAVALPDFVLDDPLPRGAVLKEGRNNLVASLGAGETTLTYSFDWAGERRAAVTEPDVRWRY